MSTQADRADALGMPPDEVETLAPSGGTRFDSNTHEMRTVAPAQIKRWDILKWQGSYRTVSSVIVKPSGDVAVYLRDLPGHLPCPADIAPGVIAITVWRPKTRPAIHV